MGWSYRKSLVFGPFRVNVSKSGVGYSAGAGGFRVGRSATGRNYQSLSIPGTGLRYYTSKGQKGTPGGQAGCLGSGCMMLLAAGLGLAALGAWMFL